MRCRPFVVSLLLLAGSLLAQPPAGATSPKSLRLHVIGASVSAGFRDGLMFGAKEAGDSVTMQQLCKAWCGEHARASTHGTLEMMQMFTGPEAIGARQIEGAKKQKPDFVIAIDFPFWFAYGHVKGEEGPARLALLDKGLALLGQLEMPVVIGDLPDFTGAAPRMLRPAQIPTPAVLAALNEKLAKWVAAHANVKQVKLADFVKTMKDTGAALPLAGGAVPTAPGALLQGDHLHANRLGMAFLGLQLQETLRALFPEGHALKAQQWTFEQFVAGCGAEAELEAALAAAKAGKQDDGAKKK